MAAQDAPYILLMDANVDEDDSYVLRNAVRLSQITNVLEDRNASEVKQPTFQLHGILETPIPLEQSGTSTIDYVFANAAANLLIVKAEQSWELTEGLGHVPLYIEVDVKVAKYFKQVASSVDNINVARLAELNDVESNLLYNFVKHTCGKHGIGI